MPFKFRRDRVLERGDPVRCGGIGAPVVLYEERARLGIEEMVRRGRPDESELWARLRPDELQDVLAVVEAQHDASALRGRRGQGAPAQKAAQVGAEARGDRAPGVRRQRSA